MRQLDVGPELPPERRLHHIHHDSDPVASGHTTDCLLRSLNSCGEGVLHDHQLEQVSVLDLDLRRFPCGPSRHWRGTMAGWTGWPH